MDGSVPGVKIRMAVAYAVPGVKIRMAVAYGWFCTWGQDTYGCSIWMVLYLGSRYVWL